MSIYVSCHHATKGLRPYNPWPQASPYAYWQISFQQLCSITAAHVYSQVLLHKSLKRYEWRLFSIVSYTGTSLLSNRHSFLHRKLDRRLPPTPTPLKISKITKEPNHCLLCIVIVVIVIIVIIHSVAHPRI